VKRLLWLGPLVLGAIVHGCSGERGGQRVEAPAAAATAPRVPSLSVAEAEARPGERLDLERFRPLLAEPVLVPAREALERGDLPGAARALEAVMAASPPPASEVERWQMLLAIFRERAGDLLGASASYQLAARTSWPLSAYARFGAARVSLRAGQAARALEHLAQVGATEPLAGDARLLGAEAHLLLADTQGAAALWREHLATESAADVAVVALRLGEVLLANAPRSEDVPGGAGEPGAPRAAKSVDPDPGPGGVAAAPPTTGVREVVALARRAIASSSGKADVIQRASALEARALARLAPGDRASLQGTSSSEQLVILESLIQSKRHAEAELQADQLVARLPKGARWGEIGCEASVLRAKALAGLGKWGPAADFLGDVARACTGDDVRARALFLAGKYSESDKRYAGAIRHYEQLERELPAHRLADDARLRAAMSHLALGAEARFTDLLARMPDDYPTGDMVLDGVFQLATRRMEKGDWSGAAGILDRAARLARPRDRARGHEFAGRERYFLARSRAVLGEREGALDEFERIVREYQLSY
jgi:soluble lytic murein transglycosylase